MTVLRPDRFGARLCDPPVKYAEKPEPYKPDTKGEITPEQLLAMIYPNRDTERKAQ